MQHVTVVTGAGSGIGAALTRRLARPGAALLLHTGHNRAGLDLVATAARAAGAIVGTIVQPFDDGDAAPVIEAAVTAFGRVDALAHVAGGADPSPYGTLDLAGLQRAVTINAGAFMSLATALLPHVRPGARVVTVGSFLAHAYHTGLEFPATAAAKAALVALTRTLAMRLAPHATVNGVVPGYVAKDPGRAGLLDPAARDRALSHIPLARFAQPDEVAGVIAFLLGPDGGYITGQCIHVDGGVTR